MFAGHNYDGIEWKSHGKQVEVQHTRGYSQHKIKHKKTVQCVFVSVFVGVCVCGRFMFDRINMLHIRHVSIFAQKCDGNPCPRVASPDRARESTHWLGALFFPLALCAMKSLSFRFNSIYFFTCLPLFNGQNMASISQCRCAAFLEDESTVWVAKPYHDRFRWRLWFSLVFRVWSIA